MNKEIAKEFKESMHSAMLKNFRDDGSLIPVFFYLEEMELRITPVDKFLESPQGKATLTALIKATCSQPEVTCAGLIIEGWMSPPMTPDSELLKLLESGNLTVSELVQRQDVITMTFSSRFGEVETIVYKVEPKTKMVLARVVAPLVEGEFIECFIWKRNEQ